MRHRGRVYFLLCFLLLSTALANVVQWRLETRELETAARLRDPGYLISKMPSLPHLERTTARREIEVALVESQNCLLREEVVRRFGAARLIQIKEQAHRSTESFLCELWPSDETQLAPQGHAPGAPLK